MKVVKLNNNNLKQFISYCRKHKTVHDASYLYEDEDLKTFKVSEADPALLIMDNEKVTGAFSIMAGDFANRGSVRARIFHCENQDGYKPLLEAMKRHCMQYKKDITGVHLFIPENAQATQVFKSLNFTVSSKSYRMVYDANEHTLKQFALPKGFILCPLNQTNTDQWKRVYDRAFSYNDNNSPICQASLMEDLNSPYVIKNGMMMICKGNEAVGLIVLSKDDSEIPEIETLAVHPDYQGKGIGSMLLQYGIITIVNGGYSAPTLSVSSQRPNALHIYKKAGFVLEKTFLVMEHMWQNN